MKRLRSGAAQRSFAICFQQAKGRLPRAENRRQRRVADKVYDEKLVRFRAITPNFRAIASEADRSLVDVACFPDHGL